MLEKIGQWCFVNKVKTLIVWILFLVIAFGASAAVGNAYDSSFSIPASDSKDGLEILQKHFPGSNSVIAGSIVFESKNNLNDPQTRIQIEKLFQNVAKLKAGKTNLRVKSFYDPSKHNQIVSKGQYTNKIAYADVEFGTLKDQQKLLKIKNKVEKLLPKIDGVNIYLGGQAFASFQPPSSELVGLSFAIIILILAFGSVLAMGLPVGVAVAGVGAGGALITLLTHIFSIPDFAPTLGAMIGLGVGIDYALFIITRYREGLQKGLTGQKAIIVAIDTAGRAVIFAGITVVISLLGMLLMGLSFISGLGISASLTVLVTMIASITLLPALLGFAKDRVNITKLRGILGAIFVAATLLSVGLNAPKQVIMVPLILAVSVLVLGLFVKPLKKKLKDRKHKPIKETFAYKWSRMIQHRPLVSLLAGAILLIVLAIPTLSLRLGFSDLGNYPEKTDTKKAYDLISKGFGKGVNGPLVLVTKIDKPESLVLLKKNVSKLNVKNVEFVSPVVPNNFSAMEPQNFDPTKTQAAVVRIVPKTGPQDERTSELVTSLREDIIPKINKMSSTDLKITGTVAANIDFSNFMKTRMLVFFFAVLSLSFLLLMAVFRSILVPLKAVIMNILSIGAAYGVLIAVFQWGWLHKFFGIGVGAPIEPFLPMMIFAIVFGLSMDYEVFLLSRVKEEYDKSGDAKESVADGLANTARVITAAAAIMIVVFGSFIFEDNRIIKMFGLGLASAILLDATVVRMLLVPATMELLGKLNWWFPKWLDKIIPQLHVEGSKIDLHETVSSDSTD